MVECLLPSPIRSNNDEFRFALNPEMRRVIRQVRNQGDKRRSDRIATQAFGNGAIEMRNYGEHQVCRMLRPVRPEQFHDRRMVDANRPLQHHQQLRRKTRPAFAQDQIVSVLNAQAGGAANQVERIEQFLNVEKSDIPRMLLAPKAWISEPPLRF